MAWGVWQLPEDEVRALPEAGGKDVLELGCGACQWSIALARRGARPVGLDVSARQLEHARRLMAQACVDFPLVRASAEDVPLPDAGFDLVFADHGAFGFTDPYRTVPEAARLLRPGGELVFSMNTPISEMCWGDDDDDPGTTLLRDYYGLRTVEAEGTIDFQLGYGEWIRLFAANGLQPLDLIELRPPADAVSSYRSERSRDWARRWPMDHIWKLRRL
ncbi:MAG TPA: class I SAM-dependent methyltransferase [Nakamurella sp.]|nr:class I SAM-dependent methyltransferase [Nakamurella sp.]